MAEDFSRGLIYGPIILRTYLLRTFLFTDLTVFFSGREIVGTGKFETFLLFSCSKCSDLLSYSA